jgi:hypothetical protein
MEKVTCVIMRCACNTDCAWLCFNGFLVEVDLVTVLVSP